MSSASPLINFVPPMASIAQWHWESPAEIYRRKKDIVHAIRYLLFAHQILLHGKARHLRSHT